MSKKQCMVIGDPISQSLSPKMHNAGYSALGIDDQFEYVASQVSASELKTAVERIRSSEIRGVSVTMPHKEVIIPFLDTVDSSVERIGAVNTVVNEDGKLTGTNTDWIGIIEAVKNATRNGIPDRCAIIGAGGTARAALYGLRVVEEKEVVLVNRSEEKGERLAEEFGASFLSLSDIERLSDYGLIVNTTSVGMKPEIDQTPVPKTVLRDRHLVLDAVYSPIETKLLRETSESGGTAISGLEMLLYQGIEQFKLYTGYEAPEKEIREVLMEVVGDE